MFECAGRSPRKEKIDVSLAVTGGGLAGVCAAIAAARRGVKVALIQDRPVLGGNASSEIRLWALGATSHMGNNNRWSREDGIIGEILTENLYRNREGNPVLLDALLLDKVLAEKNITLLLNTVVYKVSKKDERTVESLTAFNPQNDTQYTITAGMFIDASGDGTVAYQAGAAFRMGGEERDEFGESFSASDEYGELLGHSMFFYTKKCDHKVKFVAPGFALKDMSLVPKYETIKPDMWGCNYWWFEYGGTLDTVHDTEAIRQEITKVIYGAWDYIKNSGKFPEADNLTLEWVANIPGKRESRRFEGLYMLRQQDIIEQTVFEDAVAYGGWAIDLHPAKGLYSPLPSCSQYHSKGIYSIPLRCYIPKDLDNLLLAGRIISSSHIAFGSTRVMATCALGGQAVGEAAAVALRHGCTGAGLLKPEYLSELRQNLALGGQSVPGLRIDESLNLLSKAVISPSSTLELERLKGCGEYLTLSDSAAQMLPLEGGKAYSISVNVEARQETSLTVELAMSSKAANYTPDVCLESRTFSLSAGKSTLDIVFKAVLPDDRYAFLIFRRNPAVGIELCDSRISGILSVFNRQNLKVGNFGKQIPPEGTPFESFEFWCPERRPGGKNIALSISPAIKAFGAENLPGGLVRPGTSPNAWVARPDDTTASLTCSWAEDIGFKRIRIFLDSDFDHAMETVQWGHPEDRVPFCVQKIRVYGQDGKLIAAKEENHQSISEFRFDSPVSLRSMRFEFENTEAPVSVFGIYID